MRAELINALREIDQGMALLRTGWPDERSQQRGDLRQPGNGAGVARNPRKLERSRQLLLEGASQARRFASSRVHKASNADSIASHVLRSRGWTRQFRNEQLSGKQHLSLLEDCRQYGRQWMRHEAEQLFDRYGVEIDDVDHRSLGAGRPGSSPVRELQSADGAALSDADAVLSGMQPARVRNSASERTGDSALDRAAIERVAGRQKNGGVIDGPKIRAFGDPPVQRAAEFPEVVGNGVPTAEGSMHLSVSRGIADRAKSATARFFRRSKQFIHELIIAGGMLLKGSRELSANEMLAIDRQAKVQAEYLERFEREVVANPPKQIADLSSVTTVVSPPPMTPGQFIARAESYGNAPWQVQNIGRSEVLSQRVPVTAPKAPPSGAAATPGVTSPITATRPVFVKERRVHLLTLEEHRPCATCLSQSKRGWQDPGTLLEIGDAECKGNCDCYFEWMDDKNKVFVSPWGRHNPHGHNQPGEPQSKLPGIAYPPEVPIPALPGGPGPTTKKKLKLKPLKPKPAPEPESYEPGKLPTLKELLEQAGSPYPESEYEEA